MESPSLSNRVDESIRRKFESAWVAGRPDSIESCLPPPTSELYLGTLIELVCIDFENRWKAVHQAAKYRRLYRARATETR